MAKVLDSQAGDVASSAVNVPNDMVQVFVEGDLGGGSVTLQKESPAGNYHDVANGSFSAAGYKHPSPGPGRYRLNLSGTGGTSDVDAWIIENEAEARRLASI